MATVTGSPQQRVEAYLVTLRARLRGMNDDDVREIVEELRAHITDKATAERRVHGGHSGQRTRCARQSGRSCQPVPDGCITVAGGDHAVAGTHSGGSVPLGKPEHCRFFCDARLNRRVFSRDRFLTLRVVETIPSADRRIVDFPGQQQRSFIFYSTRIRKRAGEQTGSTGVVDCTDRAAGGLRAGDADHALCPLVCAAIPSSARIALGLTQV